MYFYNLDITNINNITNITNTIYNVCFYNIPVFRYSGIPNFTCSLKIF